MASATFHSIRGAKSTTALLLVKSNPLEFSAQCVYVPLAGASHFAGVDLTVDNAGLVFEIPDGYTLVDIMDDKTGKPRTTKDGKNILKSLKY